MKEENHYLRLIILIQIIVLIWLWSWILIDKNIPAAERANFGDKFGVINSLFSGLALAVIIYSIILQQKELNLQRKELSETREEFKDQNFQTTFFNLLRTQQQIANEIRVTISDLRTYSAFENREANGREFFFNSRIELYRIASALEHPKYVGFSEWDEYDAHYNEPDNDDAEASLTKLRKLSYTLKYYRITKSQWERSKGLEPVKFAEFCYKIFFRKFQYAIGHYFRHLYHILLFLEETEKDKILKKPLEEKTEIEEEFQRYANFVQAQMATPELFLLFYNSLNFLKMKRIVIKYNTLENLCAEDLINIKHNDVEGINLKSLKDFD